MTRSTSLHHLGCCLSIAVVPWLGLSAVGSAVAGMPESAFSGAARPLVTGFFEKNCVACHDADAESGVQLDDLSFDVTSIELAERWQKVLNVLNSGEMPPPDEPRPDAAAKAEVLAVLSRAMVAARKTLGDQGRTTLVRRLNRREYAHTLRDLLGVEVDVSGLPADTGTADYDTISSGLFMSSDQFELYLKIAREALAAAASDWPQPGVAKPERKQGRREVEIDARKKIESLLNGYFRDGNRRARAWKESGGKPPSEFGFLDEKAAEFILSQTTREMPYLERYLAMPKSDTGAWLMIAANNLHEREAIAVPPTAAPGEYLLRVRIGAAADAPSLKRFVEFGTAPLGGGEQHDLRVSRVFQITGTVDAPQTLEIPVRVAAGGPRTWYVRPKRYHDVKAEKHQHWIDYEANGVGTPHALWIDWVEWDGPLPKKTPAPVKTRVFDGLPEKGKESDLARTILRRFATLAFRGAAPSKDFLDRLLAVYRSERDLGRPPIEAIREPMAVILASPGFLYLADPLAADGVEAEGSLGSAEGRRLSARELASRLSYFLWAAPPDDALLAKVADDSLRDPAVLAAEVERMLADPKSRDFAIGFAHQWLGLDRLAFFDFDHELYPDFDNATRDAARQEVYETVHTLLAANLDARKLLASDFVVVNGLLATYYGLDDGGGPIVGDEFRVVKLPKGSPRGGLLGMAAILAMGSNGERTSPVERGAWVLRKLLNNPPPPAPPNVPQLLRLEGKEVSTRERLKMHQDAPQCAQCHRQIDPVGFGLENFDAAGRWRTEDAFYGKGWIVKDKIAGKVLRKTWPIDPAGAFYGGPKFADFFELREIIATRSADAFARGLIENLFAYALGRPVSFADGESLDRLAAAAKRDGYRLRSIVQAIVASEEFCTK